VAHSEDDEVYGRSPGRHGAALARRLRAPAPDLGAVAEKLDSIVQYKAVELDFADAAVASLRKDIRYFAGLASSRLCGFA
jgi:hypothetical protein